MTDKPNSCCGKSIYLAVLRCGSTYKPDHLPVCQWAASEYWRNNIDLIKIKCLSSSGYYEEAESVLVEYRVTAFRW